MPNPEDAAKEFLKGLSTRKRQPWDDVAEYSERERKAAAPAAKPTPPPPSAPRQPADDAMEQAERIAARNREIAKRTRHLRD